MASLRSLILYNVFSTLKSLKNLAISKLLISISPYFSNLGTKIIGLLCLIDKEIVPIPLPLIIRLQGTNAIEAKKLIDISGLEVESVILLQEAADKVTEVLS